jgi:hypothetical protein
MRGRREWQKGALDWGGGVVVMAFPITSISERNSVPVFDAAACVYDGGDL